MSGFKLNPLGIDFSATGSGGDGGVGPLPNNVYLNGRDNSDTTDIPVAKIDTNNHLIVGDINSGTYMQIIPGSYMALYSPGTYMAFRTNTIYLQPYSDANMEFVILGAGHVKFSTEVEVTSPLTASELNAGNGATGTFTTADLKTVTVTNGIITSIV